MSRIEINEIVESLERVVEYTGEQTHIEPIAGERAQEFMWTALRDLARCVRDITSTPTEDIPLDFEGEKDTIDSLIQGALGSHSLGQAQLDAMRRLAKEILFLRAMCRSSGLSMKFVERQVSEMISKSEVEERVSTGAQEKMRNGGNGI